ncbi:MAG: tRNA(5-methylaminomethyl-2-thiouridylate) methyltransferase [Desulfovibrio sp.]|jgi:hypothetical protein|nr:tRNA(5-methylaminomethyl-2-thiouridylate) methyltransferase [Desulfovibrio sp.]
MQPQIVVLLSGGLDSLLTSKLLQRQGLAVRCLHFVSPFFGSAAKAALWREWHGLDIDAVDIGEEYVRLLQRGPVHGFGKVLNPCVDCKIFLLSSAKAYMEKVGAKAIATGEVLGQRPMSQRRDSMDLILKEAGVKGALLRPLCAKLLPPTPMETEGLVDRERLLDITGRSRKRQLALAEEFGLTHIPSPAGGCKLTERERVRRYWPILVQGNATVADFAIVDHGRQLRDEEGRLLVIGRNQEGNDRIAAARRDGDVLLELEDVPGPAALARLGETWPEEVMEDACAMTASFSPKAVAMDRPVMVRRAGSGEATLAPVLPKRITRFREPPSFKDTREAIREWQAASEGAQTKTSWSVGKG